MKLLPIFESILRTNLRGRNLLYHSTQLFNLFQILDQDTIQARTGQAIKTKLSPKNPEYFDDEEFGGSYGGVSLTRDPEFLYGDFQLILNGDALRRAYKIVPYDYFSDSSTRKFARHSSLNEFEEFLIGPLKHVRRYLVGLRIKSDYELTDSGVETIMDLQKRLARFNIAVYDEDFKPYTFNTPTPVDNTKISV